MKVSRPTLIALAVLGLSSVAIEVFFHFRPSLRRAGWVDLYLDSYSPVSRPARVDATRCGKILSRARELTMSPIRYDPAYFRIGYPKGDVPDNAGVCADVIIRAFRAAGIDFQALVHDDMSKNFSAYPALWSLAGPDPNIDHRRVPNLMTYLTRFGSVLPISASPGEYHPCDIAAWDVGAGVTHIGIVSDRRTFWGRPLVLHHIRGTPSEEDALFRWRMIGHFAF